MIFRKIRNRFYRLACSGLIFLALTSATQFSSAFSLIADERTAVRIRGNFAGALRETGDFTDDGSTSFLDTVVSTHPTLGDQITPGWVEGFGSASFSSLGARVRHNAGSTYWGEVNSSAHSIISVGVPTGVLPGTAGIHTYVFDINGSGIFDYDPFALNDWLNSGEQVTVSTLVNASVSINTYVDDGNGNPQGTAVPGGGVLDAAIIELSDLPAFGPGTGGTGGPFNVVIKNKRVEIDVPIVYGESFGLNVGFKVQSFTDSRFLGAGGPPDFISQYGSRFLTETSADFSNTANLVAIVDTTNPDVSVIGQNFDYSGLVTAVAPAPVPIPAPIWLLASALAGLVFSRNKSR